MRKLRWNIVQCVCLYKSFRKTLQLCNRSPILAYTKNIQMLKKVVVVGIVCFFHLNQTRVETVFYGCILDFNFATALSKIDAKKWF